VMPACGNLDDVRPVADITLWGVIERELQDHAETVVSSRDHGCYLLSSHNRSRIQHRRSKNKAEDESEGEQGW